MKFYFVNSYAQQTLITFIKKQTLITIYNILKLVYYPTKRLLIKKLKLDCWIGAPCLTFG